MTRARWLVLALLGVACGGSSAPPQTCQGKATACADLIVFPDPDEGYVRSKCAEQRGCELQVVECTETQYQTCADFTSQSYCEAGGCAWAADTRTCSGSKTACSTYPPGSLCPTQLCSYSGYRCGGTARACSALTTNISCDDQHGCLWN